MPVDAMGLEVDGDSLLVAPGVLYLVATLCGLCWSSYFLE